MVSSLNCFSDYVDAGVNGLVFDHRLPDPVRSLTILLENALNNAPATARMGRRAHEKAQAFSYEAIAGRHLGIFEQLLSNDAFLTDFQAEIPNLLSQRPPKGRASDSEGTARVL